MLDTGVDASTPDLDGQLVAGTSMLDGSAGTTDPNGHGTWMAGIIAAATDNGQGIAGVGYAGVRVMPVTVLGADGLGQDSDIIEGVVWAVQHGADVINMSFSNPGYSSALQAAIDYAWDHDVVVVAATGNDGSSAVTFPAGDRGVIGVSATDHSDTLAPSSNFGPAVFLAAPGVDIITTAPGGGSTSISGTSASSAIVAAAAALLRAADPGASNGVIVGRLARNADPAGSVAETGNGRVNLARALSDTSSDGVKPHGAAPVGDGGPIVGPYRSATTSVDVATITARDGASCTTAQSSFVYGSSVCAHVVVTATSGGGGAGDFFIQWRPPVGGNTNHQFTVPATVPLAFDDTFAPTTNGSWTIAVCKNTACSGGNQIITTTIAVTQKPLTVVGITANNKVYNGLTDATFSGAATLSGVVSPDVVTLGGSPVATFADKNVGTAKTVSVTGYTIGGAGASKYTLTQPTLSANITAKPLTVAGITAINKVYNGLTDATLTGIASLSGVISPDVVSLGGSPVATFADKNVGTAKTVSVTGYTIGGAGASNYTLTQPTLSANITQAGSTVTVVCPVSVVYTGLPQTPCTASWTSTGADAEGAALSVSHSGNVNVGTANASATFLGDANHTGSSNSATFAITKATLDVDAQDASKTYGDLDPAFGYELSGFVNGEDATGAGVTGSPVCSRSNSDEDAGTYTDVLSCLPGTLLAANYAFVTGDSADFTIDQAGSTVTVVCPVSVVYTGLPQTPCTASWTSTGADAEGAALSVSHSGNVNVGTANASATFLGDANHTGSSNSATFAITKATLDVDAQDASKTYGDLDPAFGYELSGFVNGEDATGAGVTGSPVCSRSNSDEDAGTYTDVLSCLPGTLLAANYAFVTGDSADFTIDQAGSTVTVVCPVSVVYTGLPQTPCTASWTSTGADAEGAALSVSHSGNVNVGTANASATFLGDANHTGSSNSATFAITKATLDVDAQDASKTYGDLDPAFGYELSGFVNGEDATGAGVTGSPVCSRSNSDEDAGTYTDVLSCLPGTLLAANYAFVTGDSADFTIDQAGSTVTVVCPVSVVYTGLPQTPCTASWTSTGADAEGAALSVSHSGNVNVGTANASATFLGDANHTGSSNSATFAITKATLDVDAQDASKTYGDLDPAFGYELSGFVNGEDATGAGVTGSPVCSRSNSDEDAGTYTDVLSCLPGTLLAANYAFVTGDSADFTIDQAGSTVTVVCPVSVVYTGLPQTPCTASWTSTGADAEGAALSVSHSGNVNVGTANASATFLGDANHTGSSNSATFAITKATLDVDAQDASKTYGDLDPAFGYELSGFVNGEDATGAGVTGSPVCSRSNSDEDAGTYTDVLSCLPGTLLAANYAFVTGDSADFTIDQAGSTVTVVCPVSVVYTGLPQTPCTASWTSTGADAEGAALSVSHSGNVNVGTANASATFLGDANHTGSSNSATFAITASGLKVTKTATVASVDVGDAFAYTVTVENASATAANGAFTVTDDLPVEVSYVSVAGPDAADCSEASGTVTCSRSSLAAGASVTD